MVNGSILKNGVWDKTGNNVSYYGGFVGIGKSPNYTLDVAGTINATEILVNGQPISAGSGGTVNGITEMSGKLGIALDDNSILSTTSLTDYKLFVGGGMIAEKVQVKTEANWPDYVFEPTYNLRSLSEVEQFISKNKHLPEVPSAKEMDSNGHNLGKMDAVLLQKIEELTLYMIDLKKENEALKNRVESLEKK